MKIVEPQEVKYFIGALFSNAELLSKALKQCEDQIGKIDLRSVDFPFDCTSYYDAEMGEPIFRTFISFEQPRNPGDLAELKVLCNQIEENLALQGKRKVNLDVGYLDFHKLVLASAKYNGQKIYLDRGIYADPTLYFENGQFHPFENTFPDFKSKQYLDVFTKIRQIYKSQLRS